MTILGFFLTALAILAFALGFIALGMALATMYNKQSWKKYYEGRSEKGGIRA